eukprot:11596946-Alexandrium_andersonii.AAC.1
MRKEHGLQPGVPCDIMRLVGCAVMWEMWLPLDLQQFATRRSHPGVLTSRTHDGNRHPSKRGHAQTARAEHERSPTSEHVSLM